MNIQVDEQKQPISDDQELAKALAGVNDEVGAMSFGPPAASAPQGFGQPTDAPAVDTPVADQFAMPPVDLGANTGVAPVAPPDNSVTSPDPALASVKQAAITELRPLIDKLDVNPEEKFNTYLLLIRSTDDKDLIAPAHEAAKGIADEAKKAQALLDIIKEIDFLSNPNQQQ